MTETNQLLFKYREVVEALIKHSDIHEGLWNLAIQFRFEAVNTATSDPKPGVVVTIDKLGISREDKKTPVTVDASVVNPARARKTRRKVYSGASKRVGV